MTTQHKLNSRQMLVCHVSFPSFLIVGIVEMPNKAPINDDPTLVYILSPVKLCATIKPTNIATLIEMNKVVRVFCLMMHPLVMIWLGQFIVIPSTYVRTQ